MADSTFPIYLDSNSTTPVDPVVLETMIPFFSEQFGNSSSPHAYGWRAQSATEVARKQVAQLLHCDAQEITFTSGATESTNLALRGLWKAYGSTHPHFITSNVEHAATLETLKDLEAQGASVTWLAADKNGCVTTEQIKNALTPLTLCVSLIWANNEIGSLNEIESIAQLLKDSSCFFHVDAVQGLLTECLDLSKTSADLVSVSAHKIYGPQGIGALFVRRKSPRIKLQAVSTGGGQEKGLRPGTLPTALIVGFGKACELAQTLRDSRKKSFKSAHDFLKQNLSQKIPGIIFNGHPSRRIPQNLSFTIPKFQGSSLLTLFLKDLALSQGSACSQHTSEPSHVLRAIGLSSEDCRKTLRIGLPIEISQSDLQKIVEVFSEKLQPI